DSLTGSEGGAARGSPKHVLALRAGSYGIVAGGLVAVWALTGPDLPWVVWPPLGLGLFPGGRRRGGPRPAVDRRAAPGHWPDRGARRLAGARDAAAQRGGPRRLHGLGRRGRQRRGPSPARGQPPAA